MKKARAIYRRMRENNVHELQQNKQISLPYSIAQTLKYQYLHRKNIYIGSRTIIANPENLEITANGRLEIAFGDFGLATKNETTYIKLGKDSRMFVDGAVCIGRGCNIGLGNGASLTIGNGTFITGKANLMCLHSIEIGERCAISWGTQIMDDDFHKTRGESEPPKRNPKGVIIGEHVWIGSNVTILKDVQIGDGCIVGANAVVTRSVPARCMVGGNPAKVIKENVEWE